MNDFSRDSVALYSKPILVVDDNPANLELIETFLTESGFKVLVAEIGKNAIERARLGQPNLILLDIILPDIDGFELCQTLKNMDSTRNIPIIFMTALSDTEDKIRGFQCGAVDYITKPINKDELLMRIRTHLRLYLLNENLEAEVSTRTQKLKKANKQLQQEIEERKQAEKALRESEVNLKRSQAVAHVGDWTWDARANTVTWSDELYQILQLDPEDITNDLLSIIAQRIHPDDRSRISLIIENSLTNSYLKALEFRMLRSDDSICWVWTQQGKPVFDETGQLTQLSGIIQDITERKQAENELFKQNAQLEAILAVSQDFIFILDSTKKIIDYRAHHESELYVPSEVFLGKTFHDVLPPNIGDLLDNALEDIVKSEKNKTIQYLLKSPQMDEEKWYEATISTKHEQIIVVVQDITKRKEAENTRERLISELKAKNFELEQFTYTVSHDLKSPLITIKGFLSYLEKDAIAGNIDAVKDDITHISDATDKMNQLLNELLELSRIGRLVNQPQEISLNLIVTEALNSVSNVNERNFSIEIMPNLPNVYADRGRILQVFENFIANAIKFSRHKSAPKIEIGFREDNAETIIYVKDNGIGIAPEYHDKVFGLFNQLDQTIEGTGIGLAIIKRIIETYNGRIWVESDGKDKGSTFCFTLANSINTANNE